MVIASITREELLAEILAVIGKDKEIPVGWFTLKEMATARDTRLERMRELVATKLADGLLVHERIGNKVYYHVPDKEE